MRVSCPEQEAWVGPPVSFPPTLRAERLAGVQSAPGPLAEHTSCIRAPILPSLLQETEGKEESAGTKVSLGRGPGGASAGFVQVGVPEAAVSLTASPVGGCQTHVPVPAEKWWGGAQGLGQGSV